jgi:hypothetical protein
MKVIHADMYDKLVQMISDWQSGSYSIRPGGSVPKLDIVRVKNTTGQNLPRLSILGLSGTVWGTSGSITLNDQFQSNVVFTGVIPTTSHTSGLIGILLEAAIDGQIVRAAVHGTAPVQINVTDASHTFADTTPNDPTQLTSASSGVIQILWKENGTGTKNALVRFGGGGGGGLTIEWGTVIEMPIYADPASFSLSGGQAYYTVRDIGSTYSVYSSATYYALNAQCLWPATPTGLLYNCIKVDENNNTNQHGHEPDISPTYWQKQSEIHIDNALGADGFDIRLFTPWFTIGSVVPIVNRNVSGVGTRYYIWAAMQYGGTSDQASIRWNATDNRAMACYK